MLFLPFDEDDLKKLDKLLEDETWKLVGNAKARWLAKQMHDPAKRAAMLEQKRVAAKAAYAKRAK